MTKAEKIKKELDSLSPESLNEVDDFISSLLLRQKKRSLEERKTIIESLCGSWLKKMNDNDYRFLSGLAKEEGEDISKTVRELIDLGRVALAVEKYRKSEASIEKAAHIAGVSISKMMDILKEHGVEVNLEFEDYLKGLKSLRKVW